DGDPAVLSFADACRRGFRGAAGRSTLLPELRLERAPSRSSISKLHLEIRRVRGASGRTRSGARARELAPGISVSGAASDRDGRRQDPRLRRRRALAHAHDRDRRSEDRRPEGRPRRAVAVRPAERAAGGVVAMAPEVADLASELRFARRGPEPESGPDAGGARLVCVPIAARDVARPALLWNLAVEMARQGTPAALVVPAPGGC